LRNAKTSGAFTCPPVLPGGQAGLSWTLILKKRTGYEQAFDGFDAHKIARYDDSKVQEFLQAVGMVNDHTVECFRWQEVQLPAR
jgi:3-methyladenine DNA glycosylase Tag